MGSNSASMFQRATINSQMNFDQQQQFMDHMTAFNDPLNSTEGPSIFNGGIDSGLDFGGGMGFGSGFGNGF